MIFFDTEDGDTFAIDAIVLLGSVIGDGVKSYYNVHLAGGTHISIRESHKSRESLKTEWMATRL
jgi:hypothetical protein